MDSFDYSDDALEATQDSTALIWNILTVVVVLMTVCLCAGFGLLLINPQSSLNRYPRPTMPVEAEMPTVTPNTQECITSYLDTNYHAGCDANSISNEYVCTDQHHPAH